MKVSNFISALAWISVIMLPWGVVIGRIQYSGFVLGVWVLFLIVGVLSGLVSWSRD